MGEKFDDILHKFPQRLLLRILGRSDVETEKKLEEIEKMYGLPHFQKEDIIERLKKADDFDSEKAFDGFVDKCLKVRKIRRFRIWGVAACIVLLLGGGLFALLRDMSDLQQVSTIVPGKSQAIVTLANGQTFELGDGFQELVEQNGSSIVQDSGQLVYTPASSSQKILYNTVSIPRGGEYRLCLSDGTRVWLNADSELRYPVAFLNGKREVSLLSGEAYFEVVSDSLHPFVVNTSKGRIEVLGTGFNIRNYSDEKQFVATLVHGKIVYIDDNESSVVLYPGQQLIAGDEKGPFVRNVDVRYYTSWKDGMYVFKKATLAEIMQELSRWYSISVFYQNPEVQHFHFTGDLRRYEHVETFLQFLELGGDVCFDVQGNTVVVRKK